MNTISLREAIIRRVEGKSTDEVRDIIDSSIGGAEVTLPGLGVLFEIIWSNSEDGIRNQLVSTLHSQLPDGQTTGANPT